MLFRSSGHYWKLRIKGDDDLSLGTEPQRAGLSLLLCGVWSTKPRRVERGWWVWLQLVGGTWGRAGAQGACGGCTLRGRAMSLCSDELYCCREPSYMCEHISKYTSAPPCSLGSSHPSFICYRRIHFWPFVGTRHRALTMCLALCQVASLSQIRSPGTVAIWSWTDLCRGAILGIAGCYIRSIPWQCDNQSVSRHAECPLGGRMVPTGVHGSTAVDAAEPLPPLWC